VPNSASALCRPFRGYQSQRGRRRRHRRSLDRRGVTVPFRVLPTSDVASTSGYSLPARPRHSQNAGSIRFSCHQPRPRMRLRRRSSRWVQPSFTVFPESPRLGSLDAEAPLMGFCSPSAHMGEESPRPRRLPGSAPRFCRVCAGGSHPADYGAARRFSRPLSDFFLSSPSHRFQAGGAPGVHPSGV